MWSETVQKDWVCLQPHTKRWHPSRSFYKNLFTAFLTLFTDSEVHHWPGRPGPVVSLWWTDGALKSVKSLVHLHLLVMAPNGKLRVIKQKPERASPSLKLTSPPGELHDFIFQDLMYGGQNLQKSKNKYMSNLTDESNAIKCNRHYWQFWHYLIYKIWHKLIFLFWFADLHVIPCLFTLSLTFPFNVCSYFFF